MTKRGHDMTKYNNPMATIHMILKRLLEGKPPRVQQRSVAGKTVYRTIVDWEAWLHEAMMPNPLAPLGGTQRRRKADALAALGGKREKNDLGSKYEGPAETVLSERTSSNAQIAILPLMVTASQDVIISRSARTRTYHLVFSSLGGLSSTCVVQV